MAIRNSSDPAIGAIMQNLAGLFAPTSPQDLAAYAATAKAKQEAAAVAAKEGRLSDFFTLLKDPNADPEMVDRLGAGNEAWAPTQGFVARNMEDATKRYGYDQSLAGTKYSANASAGAARYGHELDYRGTTENNVRDNAGRIAVETIKPVGEGEISRGLDPGLAALFGMPTVAPLAGPAKPLSVDQTLARDVVPNMTPEQLAAMAFGNTPVEQIATPGGTGPVYSTRLDALGKPAYVKPDAGNKPTLGVAMLPNGTRVAAEWGPGGWQNAQTKEVLPPDIQVFDTPKAVGTAADIGMGATTSTRSAVQGQILANKSARATATRLADAIAKNPRSQGAVGYLRGTAQDILATTDEMGALFGQNFKDAEADLLSGYVDPSVFSQVFDKSIPAIESLTRQLAYKVAAAQNPGGKFSDRDYQAALEQIGGSGIFANRQNSLAKLEQIMQSLDADLADLEKADPNFARGVGGAPSGPVTLTPGNEDADYEALPSGTPFIDPETGDTLVKP